MEGDKCPWSEWAQSQCRLSPPASPSCTLRPGEPSVEGLLSPRRKPFHFQSYRTRLSHVTATICQSRGRGWCQVLGQGPSCRQGIW